MLPQSDGTKRLDTQCKTVRTVDETIIIGIAIPRRIAEPGRTSLPDRGRAKLEQLFNASDHDRSAVVRAATRYPRGPAPGGALTASARPWPR